MTSRADDQGSPGTEGTCPTSLSEARRRAEARVAGRLAGPPAPLDAAASERLMHELSVHQVELELQNEQLRQTQSALERSRDRYISLFDHAPVGYVTLGLDGSITEANHQAGCLLAARRSSLTNRRFADFVATEDRARFLVHHSRLLQGEGTQSFDVRLRPADGRRLWIAVQMSLTTDAESGVPRCRATLVDIDARVRIQEEVARLASIVASAEDAIISLDRDGRVTSWNDAARRLFGYEAAEMLGHTLQRLVPAERGEEDALLLHRLGAGENIAHLETERLARGDVAVPVSVTFFPIRDTHGHVAGSALILRDISERRRADLALRTRMQHLDLLSQAGQALIMGSEDMAAIRRDLFQRVAAAVGCEICLDFRTAGAPGRLALDFCLGLDAASMARWRGQRLSPADLGLGQDLRSAIIDESPHAQHRVPTGPLADVKARCHAAFPLQVHERVTGLVIFASTSRDRFGDANVRLVQTVCAQVSAMLERRHLVDELRAREQTLRSADRAKDAFIATLAHELRNPLAPIRNAVEVMRHEAGALTPRVAWCREIIERQVSQMTHLLEDLLDISRLTRNRIDLRLERVDLRLAVERGLESTRPMFEAAHHVVEAQLPAEPIWLQADLTRLTQVVTNVLNNAAKYTEPGGSIVLRAWRDDAAAYVSVRDTGTGIDPADVSSVFGMFTQLAPARSRAGGGLGIGLALSRGIVELHGGTIEAHSEGRGKGSEFTVRLPLPDHAEDGARTSTAGSGSLPGRQRHGRVLVVDDNVDAAATLGTLLAMEGYEVRTAAGGAEALHIDETWEPDAMVVDIGMPEMSGYELCERVRARHHQPEPLLIACTGWGQAEDRRKSRAVGFDAHLVKPVEPEAVMQVLARMGRAGRP